MTAKHTSYRTPWTFHFSRYLGRKLTRAEEAVIIPLEKARVHQNGRPIVIIDPPGTDSTQLLIDYMLYRLGPRSPGLLYIPNRQYPIPKLPRNILVTTPRRPEHARGQSPICTLLLNAESYDRVSPLYPIPIWWDRLWTTVCPMFTTSGFLIIHIAGTHRRLGTLSVMDSISRITARPIEEIRADVDIGKITIMQDDDPTVPTVVILPESLIPTSLLNTPPLDHRRT